VEAGDARFCGDIQCERYVMGTGRWAIATADSVAGTPADEEEGTEAVSPNVEAIDEAFECQISGGVDISGSGFDDPGIAEGDRFAYIIDKEGRPITFKGGGGSRLKIGTATQSVRQNNLVWSATDQYVTGNVQNDITLATHVVRYLNTPYGQTPNVQIGAKVPYQQAEDGFYYCTGSYTDDPVGTIRANGARNFSYAPTTWFRHEDSIGRVLPHYGEEPYLIFTDSGGTISHKHGAHDLSCLVQSVDVVTSFEADFETCIVTDCTTPICFLGIAGTETC
jgi:hypothetical protein